MSQVYVWDKFIRCFHWSLVTLFIVSYLTGDEWQSVHTLSGYAITALIAARLIWGFIGSRYARFSQFVKSPKDTINYLKDIFAGHPKRYLGHNPAGGAMVVAILITLSMTTLSGMKLLAVEEGEGPFADNSLNPSFTLIETAYADSDDDDHEYEHEENEEEEFWEEIHELSINLMLLLIVLHVIGVFIASKQHKESLVKAMVTGNKEE